MKLQLQTPVCLTGGTVLGRHAGTDPVHWLHVGCVYDVFMELDVFVELPWAIQGFVVVSLSVERYYFPLFV